MSSKTSRIVPALGEKKKMKLRKEMIENQKCDE